MAENSQIQHKIKDFYALHRENSYGDQRNWDDFSSHFTEVFTQAQEKGEFGNIQGYRGRDLLVKLISDEISSLKESYRSQQIYQGQFDTSRKQSSPITPEVFNASKLAEYIEAYEELSKLPLFNWNSTERGLPKFEAYESVFHVYTNLATTQEHQQELNKSMEIHDTFKGALKNGRFHLKDLGPQFLFQLLISCFTGCVIFLQSLLTGKIKPSSDYSDDAQLSKATINQRMKEKLNKIFVQQGNSSNSRVLESDHLKLFQAFDEISYFRPRDYRVDEPICRFSKDQILKMINDHKNKASPNDIVLENSPSYGVITLPNTLKEQEYVGFSSLWKLFMHSAHRSFTVAKDGVNNFLDLGQQSDHNNQKQKEYHLAQQKQAQAANRSEPTPGR